MEKVYDIYVNGELYAQNISMDEEDATAEATAEAYDCKVEIKFTPKVEL